MAKNLKVEIIGDAASYARALNQASGATSSFGSSIVKAGKIAALALGAAGVGGAIITLKRGFDELAESQQVMAQTNAVIESTGSAANVTAKHVGEMATQLEHLTGADDETVQAGENMLLTFTNIRNQVGKGNDIFDQATKATLDMATAMNRGAIPSSEQLAKQSILVGKALNDPVKGITALRRVGVAFTDGQIKQIKALVATGKTMEAQKLILRELNKEFGGSAEAAGKTLPGQLNKLKNNFDDLAGDITAQLLPALNAGLSFLNNFIQKLSGAHGFKAKIAVLFEPAKNAFNAIREALSKELFGGFSKGGGVGPEGIKFDQGLVQQFTTAFAALDWTSVGKAMIDGIVNALRTAGDLAKTIADTVLNAVRQINWEAVGRVVGPGLAAAITVAFTTLLDPAFWARNWDLALAVGLTVFGGAVGKLAGRLGALLAKPFGDAVIATAALIERFSPRLAEAFLVGIQRLPGLIAAAFSPLTNLVSALFARLGGLATFVVKVLGIQAAISAITQFVKDVTGFFSRLASTVGSSLDSAWEKIKIGALTAAKAIVEPFSHLPFGLGGWAQKAKDAIQRQLDAINAAQTVRKMQAEFDSQVGTFRKTGGDYAAAVKAGLDVLIVNGRVVGQKTGSAVAGGIRGAAPEASAGGVAVGAAAAQGVASGIYSYLPTAVAAGIALVNATIASMRSAAAAQSPSKKTMQLGADMGEGLGVGFAGSIPAIAARAAASVSTFINTISKKITESKSTLMSAFRDLASNALAAFDEVVSNWKPPSQILLEKMQLDDQINAAVQAIADAQAAVDAAVAARDNLTRNEGESDADFAARQAQAEADVTNAVKALGDAQRAQEELNLQLRAAQEQAAHDKQMAADKQHLNDRLLQLQRELAKHPGEYDKIQKQIIALLKKYHIPLKNAGLELSNSFAEGMNEGIGKVIAAAKKLAAALEQIPGVTAPSGGGGGGAGGPGRPPDVPGGGRGSVVAMNVTVNMPNYLGDKREAARALRDELVRINRDNALAF